MPNPRGRYGQGKAGHLVRRPVAEVCPSFGLHSKTDDVGSSAHIRIGKRECQGGAQCDRGDVIFSLPHKGGGKRKNQSEDIMLAC